MIHALASALLASLLLACVVRAARPGAVLDFLSELHARWQIFKPGQLPDKPTGGCLGCTAFWWLGFPTAMLCAWLTPAGGWAVVVPFCVFVLVEKLSE